MSDHENQLNGPLFSNIPLPKDQLAQQPVDARTAADLIANELIDEGQSRQNLATFCQTYMEPEAVELMSNTLDKNAIDKSEYPQTAEIEQRCIRILSDLWNVPEKANFIGTSTVGSSEACMLGGLAMKFRWRKRAKQAGIDTRTRQPNLVISSGFQVCWEKFCVYWDIEMRTVPIDENCQRLDPEKLLDYVDENTIGVVGILGITYTGKYDDIAALDAKLTQYNQTAKISVPIHVDGASGGFFAPFVEPDLQWDFRLDNVISISTSGHKYGLVYPGIGWIIWKDRDYLPEELVFEVSYLGGNMPTIAINFSHSASQIIGQYYTFFRYGRSGWEAIQKRTKEVAVHIANNVESMGLFDIYNRGENLPIVCYKLKQEAEVAWSLYDLADRLLMKGWQVPAYPLPENLSDTIIQRFVCRADLSFDLAESFIQDFKRAVTELNQAHVLSYGKDENKGSYGFTH